LSALHLVSLAVLLVATAWSLLLLVRSGEPRVALLTTLFLVLGVAEIVALEAQWGEPLAASAETAGAAAVLLASVLGLLALGALADMAVERDQVEALHWDSMQAIRALAEISGDDKLDPNQRLSALLEVGRTSFGLQVGVLCRVHDQLTEVVAISSSDAFPVAAGSAFPLEGSYCKDAIASERPIGIERVNGAARADHPATSAFGFQAYLATAIRVGGELYGTLGFGGINARSERFSATEKDLVSLMGQWVATEIERGTRAAAEATAKVAAEEAAAAAARAATQAAEAAASGSRSPRKLPPATRRGADVNALLRRLEPRLRRLADDRVDLTLSLAHDLDMAHAPGVPLEKLIRSLAANGLDAMPEGGSLELSTANLEIAPRSGSEMSVAAPDRYVTLSVRDTGNGIDADSLSRVFEPAENGTTGNGDVVERLHVSTIYRILQRSGGDLSVAVEPGRGTTFTVFLRRFDPPAPSIRPNRRPAAARKRGTAKPAPLPDLPAPAPSA